MTSAIQIAATPEASTQLLEKSGALLNGHFRLSSGLHSNQYFQCATLLERPENGELIVKAMAPIIEQWKPDVIVSPALGAIIFGYELARGLGIRNIFAERPEGKFELRRGFYLTPGERVVLAENVVTTGGSVLETAQMVKDLGAEVVGYAVIVDRSGGRFAPEEPVAAYAALTAATYDPETCPLCAQDKPLTKPGSRVFQQSS